MKKILMAAAAVAALASCKQNAATDVASGGQAIEFRNLNDRVGRSANAAGDDYKVYAKSSSTTAGWYLTDVFDNSNASTTTATHYWPATGSTMSFYAFAPAASANAAVTDTYPGISITYTVPSAADEDFTVAAPIDRTVQESVNAVVGFQFGHMLSKITVEAVLDDTDFPGHTVTFTSARLRVLSNGATVDPTAAVPAWTSPNATAATYRGAKTYMVMPQAATDCKVQLAGVVIKTQGGGVLFSGDLATYKIQMADITGGFGKNRHYKLTFTIDKNVSGIPNGTTEGGDDDIDDPNEGGGDPLFGGNGQISFTAGLVGWDTEDGVDTPLIQP